MGMASKGSDHIAPATNGEFKSTGGVNQGMPPLAELAKLGLVL